MQSPDSRVDFSCMLSTLTTLAQARQQRDAAEARAAGVWGGPALLSAESITPRLTYDAEMDEEEA